MTLQTMGSALDTDHGDCSNPDAQDCTQGFGGIRMLAVIAMRRKISARERIFAVAEGHGLIIDDCVLELER